MTEEEEQQQEQEHENKRIRPRERALGQKKFLGWGSNPRKSWKYSELSWLGSIEFPPKI